MNWIMNSLYAILFAGMSDSLRKFGASGNIFFTALIFNLGAFSASFLLYLIFGKPSFEPKSTSIILLAGIFIGLFNVFVFKALHTGQGVSLVLPIVRAGAVALVVVIGILFFKEKLTAKALLGLVFSVVGIYLLFQPK